MSIASGATNILHSRISGLTHPGYPMFGWLSLKPVWLLLLPVLSALHLLWALPAGTQVTLELFGYSLMPIHVDSLSLVWGYIFHIGRRETPRRGIREGSPGYRAKRI